MYRTQHRGLSAACLGTGVTTEVTRRTAARIADSYPLDEGQISTMIGAAMAGAGVIERTRVGSPYGLGSA